MSKELIESKLKRAFKKPAEREFWMKTYNILLDGYCPEELMTTELGMKKVLAVLNEMVPSYT